MPVSNVLDVLIRRALLFGVYIRAVGFENSHILALGSVYALYAYLDS